jgi:hypothetical protein
MPAEDISKPESNNEVVNSFREEIDRWFARYQAFYSQTNASMRVYRLRHVDLVSEIYNSLMVVLGDKIEEVRQAAYELNDLIDAKREELGRINECLQGVINTRNSNSASVGSNIQRCALTANSTLAGLLTNTFYPTFARIQEETSVIPISVIDVLARGNVIEDEQAILQFLDERYSALERQWISSVSTLLRWETNRFQNEGQFLASDIEICMGDATWQYLLVNSRLEGEVQEC